MFLQHTFSLALKKQEILIDHLTVFSMEYISGYFFFHAFKSVGVKTGGKDFFPLLKGIIFKKYL